MSGSVIHVYHEHAEAIADEVRRALPERRVVALTDRAALRAALPALEVVFAPEPPRDGWAGAHRLRLIQLLGAGVDQLLPSPDLPEAVEVAGVRGEFATEVAEHALAMMLVLARRIPELLADQRTRRFDQRAMSTLAGARLTIVGLGEIGTRLARRALALDMHVRGVCLRPRALDRVEVVGPAQLGDAVADAHHVVIAAPLTPATRRVFDAALFARMRPDAFVVNVARGELIDSGALIDALTAGQLGGAALDVFDVEPLPPTDALWTAPNLVITPHVAGFGDRYVARCVAILADNVHRLEAGRPRRGVVDRALGY